MVSKGWRKGDLGSYCLLGAESGWDNEKVLEIEVVVVQHCECIKCHCTIHFLIFIYFFAHVTWHVGS